MTVYLLCFVDEMLNTSIMHVFVLIFMGGTVSHDIYLMSWCIVVNTVYQLAQEYNVFCGCSHELVQYRLLVGLVGCQL